jgi:hypothetical protein
MSPFQEGEGRTRRFRPWMRWGSSGGNYHVEPWVHVGPYPANQRPEPFRGIFEPSESIVLLKKPKAKLEKPFPTSFQVLVPSPPATIGCPGTPAGCSWCAGKCRLLKNTGQRTIFVDVSVWFAGGISVPMVHLVPSPSGTRVRAVLTARYVSSHAYSGHLGPKHLGIEPRLPTSGPFSAHDS